MASTAKYSEPDQEKRFAEQKKRGDATVVDVDSVYDASKWKGLRVLVTGGNRGLGLHFVHELLAADAVVFATCRSSSKELDDAKTNAADSLQIIFGVDVTKHEGMDNLVKAVKGQEPFDVVINNAGYFMKERESILSKTIDFDEELKMIDICAVGMLRVTNALFQEKMLKEGTKIGMITSQGGSIAWRDTQCPDGGDYGHHMSKAAANMMGKLVANELKPHGIAVFNLHPSFVRTEMTAKYSDIWDREGAVEGPIAAKRILHQFSLLSMEQTGQFINCEDGLQIPW